MSNLCSKYTETLGKYFKEEQITNNFLSEAFDISGKVDTQHFVYKLNEEAIPREARKMGLEVEGKVFINDGEQMVSDAAKRIPTDKLGEWWKIKIPKERAKMPIEAFGVGVGAGLTAEEIKKRIEEKNKPKSLKDNIINLLKKYNIQ